MGRMDYNWGSAIFRTELWIGIDGVLGAPQRVAVEDGAADTPGQGHDIPEDEDDAMMCRFLVVALKYLHNDHPLHGTWPQGLCL